MSYEYPLDYETYSVKDIEKVIDFLSYLEDNLRMLDPDIFKKKYNVYRNTLSSIKEEKRIDKEFSSLSGISIYKTAKKLGL